MLGAELCFVIVALMATSIQDAFVSFVMLSKDFFKTKCIKLQWLFLINVIE